MRKSFADTLRQSLAALFIVALFSTSLAANPTPEKMKPEELVAKHLAAIGTPEALAAVKSRVMIGNAAANLKVTNTVISLEGPAQLASEGDKVLLAMIFNSNNYRYEKAGYDGQDLTVGILESGRRSILSDFFFAHESIFKEGLIGGALSSAWPLYNLATRKPKMSYSGTKKINDRQVHELKYGKGGDLQVSLFFDAETFQHVRTEYKYTVPAQMGRTSTESAAQKESIYKLIEEFSDFKVTESKLTLPHTYKVRLLIETPQRTQTLDYAMTFSQFAFNQPVEAAMFNLK